MHKYYQLINYQLDINLAIGYAIFHKTRYSLIKGWSLFGNRAVIFLQIYIVGHQNCATQAKTLT